MITTSRSLVTVFFLLTCFEVGESLLLHGLVDRFCFTHVKRQRKEITALFPNYRQLTRSTRGLCHTEQNRFKNVLLQSSLNEGNSRESKQEGERLHLDILRPAPECNADELSPATLAYIGDSVFELMVRCRYIWPKRKMSDVQDKVVAVVRAETQAKLLSELCSPMSPLSLTKQENLMAMRGRNAAAKRSRQKNGSAYQDASALETLLGYLYLTNPPRCEEILRWMQERLAELT